MTTEQPSYLKDSYLKDYKITHTQKVVWGDMDSMNHVNNTKYFYYCETARMEFIQMLFPGSGDEPLSAMKTGVALAETSCRFKVPVAYPDTLIIGSAITEIEENQFFIKHVMYSEKLKFIAAEASARMVHFDFVKGVRLPLTNGADFSHQCADLITRHCAVDYRLLTAF